MAMKWYQKKPALVWSILGAALLGGSAPNILAYSKPVTWDKGAEEIVFKDLFIYSPHAWVIVKAIELLRHDGLTEEANVAQSYLLPMLEGVTFNDVWGDADLAGASVLDYYIPGNPNNNNFGFGGAAFAYKNDTTTYQFHPFYGYGNAAEEAQFRYDYAKRIATGHWGDDPRDFLAGWVVDTHFGQDDPQEGDWAQGANLDSASGTRWGDGQTPSSALLDLLQNHSVSQVVFPSQLDPDLSTIHLPNKDVLGQAPEWLDEHFNNADDVEAYSGYDGHGFAVYANWTLDAGGSGPNCSGCYLDFISFFHNACDASPMLVRLPVNSKAHAFFQLGWSIHLLEDVTTPVHTIDSSFSTYEVHNDIESMADSVLASGSTIFTNDGHLVKDKLPAYTLSDFVGLYSALPVPNCPEKFVDPVPFFKERWYYPMLKPSLLPGEGIAHGYTRVTAEMTNQFKPYIECINTEADFDWRTMGHFTAFGLDTAIKSTAGLIRSFIEETDKTPPVITIVQPIATAYLHNATLTLDYSATDDTTGIFSLTATIDGAATLAGHGLASGQAIGLLTELTLGDHTLVVTALDNARNVVSTSVTFSVVVSPDSLRSDLSQFAAAGLFKLSAQTASLLSKVNGAAAARASGNCQKADKDYNAFIRKLQTLSGKRVDPTVAAILIADAQYLIDHCP